MPVLGVRELEQKLMMGRKSGHDEREANHYPERESRSRRGRGYRNESYDSRRHSNSRPRRSGSVSSTMSMSSRRGGGRIGQVSGGGGSQNLPSLKNLQKQLRYQYNDKTMHLVTRYIEEMELSAEIVNNINYLRRCRDLGIIPKEYWMVNAGIKNTREVVRMLDECSYRLMCHDQQYHMLRRTQLAKQLARTEEQLHKLLTLQDHERLCAVAKGHRNDLFARIRDEQRKAAEDLRKEVEDYQRFLKEKKKPRGENATTKRRQSRNRNKENSRSKDYTKGNNLKSEDYNKEEESKDSDGEERRNHRVTRRTAGSVTSHDEDSATE